MAVSNEKLVEAGPFPKGVNNVADEFKVPSDSLRAAKNVDVLDTGWLASRRGFTKKISLTRGHSGWANKHLPFALCGDAGDLIAIDANYAKTVLLSGLDDDLPVSYEYGNDSAYLMNGQITARIDRDLNVRPFGVESPNGEPVVTATSGVGGLPAGNYQVAINFMDRFGEEGGACMSCTVAVPDGGGIALAHIPQPVATDTTCIRVNVSPQNGDKLYWQRDLPRGSTTYQFGYSQLGRLLETLELVPMPAGRIVKLFNARMYAACGRLLVPSALHWYGLRDPAAHLRFPGEITMVEPSRWADIGGLYVSAGGIVYFLRGSDAFGSDKTTGFNRVPAYEFGAVPGSACRVPGSKIGINGITQDDVPVWMSENGVICAGLSDGNVVPITEGRLELPHFERGASMFIERPGRRQVLFNTSGIGAPAAAAAVDTVVATLTRNGIPVP